MHNSGKKLVHKQFTSLGVPYILSASTCLHCSCEMSDLKVKRSQSCDGGCVLVMCVLGGDFGAIIRSTFDHIDRFLV